MGKYMKFLLTYLSLSSGSTLQINGNYSELVKFVNDIRDDYHTRSVILAMSNIYFDPRKAMTALTLLKLFSSKDVFSLFITVKELTEAIFYYDNKIVQPFNVVILENFEDFNDFIKITQITKVNKYTSLIIFNSDDDKLMEICKNPKENYFNLVFNVKMLVACEGVNMPIREWYSLFTYETRTTDYATWNIKDGFKRLDKKFVFERRNSLEGMVLRVTGIKSGNSKENKKINGYFGDLLKLISEHGDFVIDYQDEEEIYGTLNNVTKKWDGGMNRLIKNKTDIGIEFSMTVERLPYIDFSDPIVTTPSSYFIEKPDEKILQWSMFYQAFGKKSAICLLGFTLIAPMIIGYMQFRYDKIYKKEKSNALDKLIRESYLDIWGIFCKMPLTNFTEVSSLRIAYISLFMLSLILSSVYSAFLTSYLAIFKIALPFDSIDEFVEDGTYKLAVIKGSSFWEEFTISNSEYIKRLKPFLLRDEKLPRYLITAIQQVCSDEKITLYASDYNLHQNQKLHGCELIAFDTGQVTSLAYAFKKDSPFLDFFNHHIRKIRASGILHVFEKRNSRTVDSSDLEYESVTFYSLVPVFAILLIGILSSLVILIFECTCYLIHKKKAKERICHEFTVSRTNYWTPLIRPQNIVNVQYFEFVN